MPERLDFKAIAEGIDIEGVARYLNLVLSKNNRANCPACNSQDHALEIIPETNTFRCWAAIVQPSKKCLGGDNIALVAHVRGYTAMYRAAKELAEVFGVGGPVSSTGTSSTNRKNHATVPRKQEEASPPATSAAPPRKAGAEPFDPVAFAGKLIFNEEVAALGFTEETAERFSIGCYRGKVYLPIRDPDGAISGFVGYAQGELKLPPRWLPPQSNIVKFPKSA